MEIYNIINQGLRIVLCILIVVLCFCYFMMFKNAVTYKMQTKIYDAVYKYRCNCIKTNKVPKVDYTDEEPYEKTMWRLWDFGYKNILPKEKYEIIKEFIENKK